MSLFERARYPVATKAPFRSAQARQVAATPFASLYPPPAALRQRPQLLHTSIEYLVFIALNYYSKQKTDCQVPRHLIFEFIRQMLFHLKTFSYPFFAIHIKRENRQNINSPIFSGKYVRRKSYRTSKIYF
ncbi:MAG: hypothetical protein IJC64_03895 [Clostridia bacterium]|nr:hypothetical protein [Clostridia bacterium]